jgi:peptide/nickel transport system permease protein
LSKTWLIRRLGFIMVVIFAALVINFAIPRLMPGGAAQVYTMGTKLPAAAQDAIARRFGLYKSVWEQFGLYIKNTFMGDFGISYQYYPTTVASKVAAALPWTLFLLMTSTIITVPVGYALGVFAGWRAGSKRDNIIQVVSLLLLATPLFWIAMILLYVFGYQLGWFPLSGAFTIHSEKLSFFPYIGDVLWHAVLPMLSLLTIFGAYQLIMRNTMVTTLREHYITTAEAKGISDNKVKFRHAARNALLPLVTSVGLRFAMLVGGSVFVEKIFSYPGIGQLIFNAVMDRDYPILQACFLIYSVVTILMIFVLDLIYLRLDPRIRY